MDFQIFAFYIAYILTVSLYTLCLTHRQHGIVYDRVRVIDMHIYHQQLDPINPPERHKQPRACLNILIRLSK